MKERLSSVSNVSAERLSAALGIDIDIERLQSWEIERANGDRTEEFLDYCDRCQLLSDDDKFALNLLGHVCKSLYLSRSSFTTISSRSSDRG